ncbi:MAG: DNA starvation/stationary phase protection protein Dps [Anaerolineae bacterium]|nr:DNA starvation/stationary phase protection protein Dps [Anaerolineae bacterium]
MVSTTEFVTRNDLAQRVRGTLIPMLNQQLADAFDLYSQTKQAHWNVKGMNFIQLHELFDSLAESVLGYVDMIAERATALGGYARGTARMAAANSTLEDFPETIVQDKQVVEVLAERYAQFGASTRAAIETALEYEDQDTADLMIEISREMDKHLWFLEAHLQG